MPEAEAPNAGRLVRDVSFELRRGEILGFAGLMGAGRTEVVRALFGMDPITSGTVSIKGQPVAINNVQDSIEHGMVMVSEDRKRYGIIPVRDCKENISLSSLEKVRNIFGLDHRKERQRATEISKRMNVKTPSLETLISSLSGGNQQKALLARWLATDPKMLILDEPTRGIDIAAKLEIMDLVKAQCRKGLAILFISSEMSEVLRVSDRIAVLRDRQKIGEIAGKDADEQRVFQMIAGAES